MGRFFGAASATFHREDVAGARRATVSEHQMRTVSTRDGPCPPPGRATSRRARDRTLPRARITPSWTRRWSSCPPSPPLPPRSRRARPRTSEAPPPIEIASTRESARLSAVTASPPRRARSRWRPSATLSRLSRNPTAPPRPAARRCSRSASRRDATRRSGRVQSVLGCARPRAQRNYGNGGSWPEAAEARRRGRCPRCDADTSEAAARAEREGIKVDPMGDPVEQARFGQHPLGWCESCAEENRLLDVSGGF